MFALNFEQIIIYYSTLTVGADEFSCCAYFWFVMKVMVCHFVSNSHEVMTALIVVLPLIVVVEISLQLHRSFF